MVRNPALAVIIILCTFEIALQTPIQSNFSIGESMCVTCSATTVGDVQWPGGRGDIIRTITLKMWNETIKVTEDIATYMAYKRNVYNNKIVNKIATGWTYVMEGGQDHATLHGLRGNVGTMHLTLEIDQPNCTDGAVFQCVFDYYDTYNQYHPNGLMVQKQFTGISPISMLRLEKLPPGTEDDRYALIGGEVSFTCSFDGPWEVAVQWSRDECQADKSQSSKWLNVPDDDTVWAKPVEGVTECTESSYPYRKYCSTYTVTVGREVCGVRCVVNSSTEGKQDTQKITAETEEERDARLNKETHWLSLELKVACGVGGALVGVSLLLFVNFVCCRRCTKPDDQVDGDQVASKKASVSRIPSTGPSISAHSLKRHESQSGDITVSESSSEYLF